MIEVIAVLMVAGVIAAVAVTKMASTASYSLAAEVDILKSHLRYAQFRALSDTKKWGISVAANSYTLIYGDGAPYTTPYLLPNEASATHSLANGISFSFPAAGATINFDQWGSPGIADITVTLSSSGGSQSFTVTKNTGFIP